MDTKLNAQPDKQHSLFERLMKGSADPNSQSFFHVPLQQKALTNTDPDWVLTEIEKRVRHCGVLFEYLHRRFGKDAQAFNAVLLSEDLMNWLCAPADEKYPLPITNFFWLILNYVTPFDRMYDIKTKKGIEDFYLELTGKYYIGMDLPSRLISDFVFEHIGVDYPCAVEPAAPALPLSRALAHLWREYIPEIPFAPHDAVARINFLMRFFIFMQMTEVDARLLTPKLIIYLNAPLFRSDRDGVYATGLIFEILRLAGFDDMAAWKNPVYVSENIARFFESAFESLILPHTVAQYHAVLAEKLGFNVPSAKILVHGKRAAQKYIMQDVPASPQNHEKAWVNLIETGELNAPFNTITRQLRQALGNANLPYANIYPEVAPYVDFIKAHHIENKPWGKINLFAVDMSKCADMMLSQGLATMNGRINIGYCTWDTSKLPQAHCVGLDLLDEIWVPSEYVKNIYSAITTKPVHVMPYPITPVSPSLSISRKLYSIPEHAFVFITTLDCFDMMARKNPLAAARAFTQAFPDNPDVRLLIKTSNMDKGNAPKEYSHLTQIQALAQKDPRIIIFHQNFNDAEMAAFISLCDCYVSLHRSSAYGRAIMEAMVMGKPVIVTAGSGCADYASEKTAAVIDAVECSIVYDAYQYLDRERGHRWLDPDIAKAATAMQRINNDKSYRQTIAKAGQEMISQHYNAEVTGAKMRARIEMLSRAEGIV